MAEDIAGRGDPIKTLQLMWGRVDGPKRGPKSRVSVGDLVQAAVRIADAEGIDAVSTRRVAEAVGISPMSFYTHIPDKAVLLDLMLDAVAGPAEDSDYVVPEVLSEEQRKQGRPIAEAAIEGAVAPGTERLARGESALVPAAAGAYALRGDATVYRASVP